MHIIVIEEKRKGMPYTRVEANLIKLNLVTNGCFKKPKSAEEMESDFWFYERGKGFFLGDTTLFKERHIDDSEVVMSGISVGGGIPAFQVERTGSRPVFRSKK